MACISISLSSSCSSLGSEEMLTNASGCGYRTDLRQLEGPEMPAAGFVSKSWHASADILSSLSSLRSTGQE